MSAHVPLLHANLWQSVSAPHWAATVQFWQVPAPSQKSEPLAPQGELISVASCTGEPATQVSIVQRFMSSCTSVSSGIEMTLKPWHSFDWQSPTVCWPAGSNVPSGCVVTLHSPAVHVAVKQKLAP